jgi:probable HAF family extracellular repeat protein
MRKTYGFKVASLILAATLLAGRGFITHAGAQERSYLIDSNSRTVVEIRNSGGEATPAYAINDTGQVVGSARFSGGVHAYITGPDAEGIRDLGILDGTGRYRAYSVANDINAAGQVVGYSSPASGRPLRAFITGPNGADMRDLGTLGGAFANADGINAAGQVVGHSTTATGESRAFITGPNGVGMRDLGASPSIGSAAFAVNDRGLVVGNTFASETLFFKAFITGPNGVGVRELMPGDHNSADDINNAGQVVGFDINERAYITGPDGVGIRDLGTLGGSFSYASAINDAGQVVGRSYTSDGVSHAFITGPNGEGMTDLNSLFSLPYGIVLREARDINNAGQILATGIPEPESYLMLLAGLGLIGFMARQKWRPA